MSVAVSGESITFNDSSVQNTAATGFGFKNRIINGAMVIDQRNAGASVTPTTLAYTLDRWSAAEQTDGSMTVQQSSTAATGFTNSLLVTVTSADASLGATQYAVLRQAVEGFNVADLGWGTANAQTITLSFWVRSSLTGTFGGAIQNSAQDRSYPFSYTISSANTFEQKTITIAGDTTGTWLTTNGTGLALWLGLGVGSTYSGTAGAWAGALYFAPTGATNLIGTNGATFYITGVQLERGSNATSFEFIDYGRQLIQCQRYFQIMEGFIGQTDNTTNVQVSFQFKTEMRASPTVSTNGVIQISKPGIADYSQSSAAITISGSRVSTRGIMVNIGNYTGLTAQNMYLHNVATNNAGVPLSSEL